MRLLIDTHTLLWWVHEPERLSRVAAQVLADRGNDILVSAVSAMEIATKARLERLDYQTPLSDQFSESISGEGFSELAVSCAHAELAGNLPGKHRDPWDRLLAAQSQIEQLPLVTTDRQIAGWNVQIIW